MTHHTAAYKQLTDSEQSRVEFVILQTSCSEAVAIAELTAEEWDTQDAVTNIYAAFPDSTFKSLTN